MAGGVPIVYRTGSGNLTFSIDYFDYAANAGYKRLYAGASEMSGATVYYLTPQTIATGPDLLWLQAQNATITGTYDLTFNNPAQVAAADALCEFTTYGNSATFDVVVTISHVRGATVTTIGQKTLASRASGAAEYSRESMVIPVTQQAFSVGDKLRLAVKLTEQANQISRVFLDPSSRDTFTENATGATIGSDFVLLMPFKIDL